MYVVSCSVAWPTPSFKILPRLYRIARVDGIWFWWGDIRFHLMLHGGSAGGSAPKGPSPRARYV